MVVDEEQIGRVVIPGGRLLDKRITKPAGKIDVTTNPKRRHTEVEIENSKFDFLDKKFIGNKSRNLRFSMNFTMKKGLSRPKSDDQNRIKDDEMNMR